jgi:hypothetical protein
MHKKEAKKQQVEANIELKSTSSKDAMQLQLNTKM